MNLEKTLLLSVVLIVFIAGCTTPSTPSEPVDDPVEPVDLGSGEGTLVISITDAESYQDDFSAINITIEEIEVQRVNGTWMSFFNGKKTFNVLELVGIKELIEQKKVDEMDFSAIRFSVTSSEIVETDGPAHSISVPNDKIVLTKSFEVMSGQITEMVIDFDPYAVVLLQGNYILQPDPLIKLLNIKDFEQKLVKDEREEELREEREYSVKIEQIVFPTQIESGKEIEFSWMLKGGDLDEGGGVISHTAVHWDLIGGHGEDFSAYENASEILTGQTPQNFTVIIPSPSVEEDVVLFFRVHAIVDEEHYYSDEMSITLMAQEQVVQQIKEFEILSDDQKFEPNQITVSEGDLVKITFNIPTTKVNWGGLDFRSDYFNTNKIKPGNSHTVEFSAPATGFQAKSYWPGTSRLKATMTIVVE